LITKRNCRFKLNEYVLAQNLITEIKRMNMNLPARVWIPFESHPHHVIRIAYNESAVLNSRDRVCSTTEKKNHLILFCQSTRHPT